MAERDEKGRFIKGNKASPGRKPRQAEADYLNATLDAVSVEDWTAIVKQAVTDAKKGNSWARSWLGDYVLGKPPQTLNINATDAKLLGEVLKAMETRGMSASEVFNAMLAEIATAENEREDGRT